MIQFENLTFGFYFKLVTSFHDTPSFYDKPPTPLLLVLISFLLAPNHCPVFGLLSAVFSVGTELLPRNTIVRVYKQTRVRYNLQSLQMRAGIYHRATTSFYVGIFVVVSYVGEASRL